MEVLYVVNNYHARMVYVLRQLLKDASCEAIDHNLYTSGFAGGRHWGGMLDASDLRRNCTAIMRNRQEGVIASLNGEGRIEAHNAPLLMGMTLCCVWHPVDLLIHSQIFELCLLLF